MMNILLIMSLFFITSSFYRKPLINISRLKNHSKLSSSNVDTIFALSSGPIVKTGVSVIRISGPLSYFCLETLLSKQSKAITSIINMPKPRVASLRYIYSPESKDILDQSLILWFPNPRSFTGEDVVELHVHGSRAVIKGVFEALEYIDDKIIKKSNTSIRPAEPGEFTRRAFENGKMDLTEVEGLSDLLDAETSVQRKQALKQMDGYLRKQYELWRDVLKKCLAHTEAVIDFGDDDREGDINDDALNTLIPKIRTLTEELSIHLRDGRKGELVREGIKIALIGSPNAGKSSLMNALAKRPAAIVSPIAGTTRDIVEVRMDLAGIPCIISDTAGLRTSSDDIIEIEGMKRARNAFNEAQIKLFVIDSSDSQSYQSSKSLLTSLLNDSKQNKFETNNDSDDTNIDNDDNHIDLENDIKPSNVLIVYNKIDLLSAHDNNNSSNNMIDLSDLSSNTSYYPISCTTGIGISELEHALTNSIQSLLSISNSNSEGNDDNNISNHGNSDMLESVIITRERHRIHVKQCLFHLQRFLTKKLPMDAAAEELRLAMLEIGKITGRVDVEQLLDIIFKDFCIGK